MGFFMKWPRCPFCTVHGLLHSIGLQSRGMRNHCKLPSIKMPQPTACICLRFQLTRWEQWFNGESECQFGGFSCGQSWTLPTLVSACMNSCDQVFKDRPDVNPHPWPDNYNACSPCRLPESVMKEAEACHSLLIPCTWPVLEDLPESNPSVELFLPLEGGHVLNRRRDCRKKWRFIAICQRMFKLKWYQEICF